MGTEEEGEEGDRRGGRGGTKGEEEVREGEVGGEEEWPPKAFLSISSLRR